MLFNSLEFFLFFPVVTLLYFLMPHQWRWLLLLLASCIFYMAFIPVYIFILLTTIVIDYTAAIYISESTGRRRKLYLIISIISTCLVLFLFKYFNFVLSNINFLSALFHSPLHLRHLNIILPIGLSFHTFQSLSYVIEVYYGRFRPEKHFGYYSLYVMFYPQLVAGPIERPQNLLPQFFEKHHFDYARVSSGLQLMLWGLFKKVVIADRLAAFVNAVYNQPHAYEGLPLIWATLFFSVQIYCDFSGYSDIAIGAAQVMGFRLMKNFDTPYLSQSVREFWSRWHISLSTWFRDYLYIPLGGNKVAKWKWLFNILIVFLVSGLWHGANWTFVVWGLLHGLYIIFGNLFSPKKQSEHKPGMANSIRIIFNTGFTFLLVYVAWIFFRANSMDDALYILTHLFNVDVSNLIGVPLFSTYSFVLMLVAVAISLLADVAIYRQWPSKFAGQPSAKYGVVVLLSVLLLLFGVFEQQEFIYFQF